MADKEATVFIVDIGRSTSSQRDGESQTDLERSLEFVWSRVTSTVALDRKTALQGMVTVRSDDSTNELSDDPSYHHISVLQELKALTLQDLRALQEQLAPSNTNNGDAISAIVIAIQMIERTCKKLKYIRRIILTTTGEGAWSGDDIDDICSKLKNDQIQLTILDLSVEDDRIKHKKGATQTTNQALLRRLCEGCGGVYHSLGQAIEETNKPNIKATRPIPSYKGRLMLGDPSQYDDALTIDVERYPRTMIRRPQTASTLVQREVNDRAGDSTQTSTTLLPNDSMDVDGEQANGAYDLARGTRTYEIHDESLEGGKKTVPLEDLAKGYEYGRTAVHVGESEMGLLNMEASANLEIVGFVPTENYDQYMGLSRSNAIVAQRGNTKASMALSSFISALVEVNSVAIARIVVKDEKPPILLLLAPVIESDLEYLVDIELPFAEDVRSYRFPPLDKVILVSGKTIKEHRHLPKPELISAMSDYVDSMDIDNSSTSKEWNPADYFNLNDSYSPSLHHIDSSVRHRAVHPDAKTPQPAPILTKYSSPHSDLVTESILKKLETIADVKKVPPKVQIRNARTTKSEARPPLDAAGLLNSGAKTARVEANNPIPTFKQMFDQPDDPNNIQKAAEQMAKIIEDQTKNSFGEQQFERIIEELKVLRSHMDEYEEPGLYNDWLKKYKSKLCEEKLGGDRKELFWKMRTEKLGLLTGGRSDVKDEEAEDFYKMKL